MTQREEQLLQEALSLPPDARADLAERLLVSLDTETDEAAEEAFGALLDRRLKDLESGQVESISGSGFKEHLRKKLDALSSGS